jgi:hypothetical protein
MEDESFERVVGLKIEYELGFKNGYNYVFYSDNPELLSEPKIDYNNFSSIGFADGYDYADYCYRVGTINDIKPDNFVAEMDKRFTTSLKRYEEYVTKMKAVDQIFKYK